MKKLLTTIFSLCLAMSMAVPAFALEENINEPNGPNLVATSSTSLAPACQRELAHFAVAPLPIESASPGFDGGPKDPTSVDTVYTADGGAAPNEDKSKNAAVIPPAFGSPGAYALNTGEYLTPNLAPKAMTATDVTVGRGAIQYPVFPAATTPAVSTAAAAASAFTEVASDLYYSGGYLATLKIPAIGVNVKVYEGTGNDVLAKGAGHFEETSIWDGRVAIAGHNRGVNCYFGDIHTLSIGDRITLTTKLGTRTYAVASVSKVGETDRGGLASTTDNTLALYTCVRDQRAYRWCVTAVEMP